MDNKIRSAVCGLTSLLGVAVGSPNVGAYAGSESCELSVNNRNVYTYNHRQNGGGSFFQYDPDNANKINFIVAGQTSRYLIKINNEITGIRGGISPLLKLEVESEDVNGMTDISGRGGGGVSIYLEAFRKAKSKLSMLMNAAYIGGSGAPSVCGKEAKPEKREFSIEATYALLGEPAGPVETGLLGASKKSRTYGLCISPFFRHSEEISPDKTVEDIYGLELKLKNFFVRAERNSLNGDNIYAGFLLGAD